MLELKETEHSYYCEPYEVGCNTTYYDSWDEFELSDGKNDFDYNLLFRYDIEKKTDEDGNEIEGEYKLQLHFALQRHGMKMWHAIIGNITKDDLPSIESYLKDRYDHLKGLWTEIEDAK